MSGCIASLTASAEAYEAIGMERDAHICRMLARDCAGMADILGSDAAEALYRAWTSEQAERVTAKVLAKGASA